MSSEKYTATVIDHFENPRNVGQLADANGRGVAGDSGCGDTMSIWIRVENDHIVDVRFKCEGCVAAIACASMTTELAKGRQLDAAAEIADDTIAEALGGLPAEKRHCSNLGAEALSNAIWDYVVGAIESGLAERGAAGQPPYSRLAWR